MPLRGSIFGLHRIENKVDPAFRFCYGPHRSSLAGSRASSGRKGSATTCKKIGTGFSRELKPQKQNKTSDGHKHTSSCLHEPISTMHLMYYLTETGERVYTLKKAHGDDEQPTLSAHPARFSPDDKFSAQRLACKKRFGLLPIQRERDAL